MILFGEFRPDAPDWDGRYARTATNVIPSAYGYLPFPSPVILGGAVSGAVRGAIAVRKNDRSYDFYAGTATTIEKYNFNTDTWANVSKSGNYISLPSDDEWGLEQFGTKLVATSQTNPMQVVDVESGGNFADLSGSPPRARGVRVFGDFLVAFDILGAPRKIQWPDINNIENWTEGGSSLAGSQTFPDGGNITAVTSAETGVIMQTGAFRRMAFIPGSTDVFHFEKIGGALGLRSPYAYTEHGNSVYFLAEDGVYSYGQGGLVNLDDERVQRFFFDNVDTDRLWATRMIADPVQPRIYLAFPSVNAADGVLDKMLVYHIHEQRWALVEQECRALFKAATEGTTLEDLDSLFATLELVTPSLDSRFWQGGAPIFGIFDTDNKLNFFTGSAKEATIDTPEVELAPTKRAMTKFLLPKVDTASAFFRVGARERSSDSVSWSDEVQMTASGRVGIRKSGKLHRFRVRIPAGTSWAHATGIAALFNELGGR